MSPDGAGEVLPFIMDREQKHTAIADDGGVAVHPLTSKKLSIVASALVIVVGTALCVIPTQGFMGMDAGSLGAVEATIATALATVLLWYGLRS